MPSEISGLPSLRGYLKLENLVVRLHFPFLDLPARHPAFVERPVIETKRRPTVATTRRGIAPHRSFSRQSPRQSSPRNARHRRLQASNRSSNSARPC